MLTAAFRAASLQHTYSPLDVTDVRSLGRAIQLIKDGLYDGANITVPYKRVAMELCDVVDASAEAARAANVLTKDAKGRVVAMNTDAAALEAEIALATKGRSRAAILGAGGAATAAIVACKKLNFAIVGVTTRSWRDTEAAFEAESAERVRALGALTAVWPSEERDTPSSKLSMAMRLQWTELAERADIVIQATSAGMLGGDPGEEVASVVPFAKMPKTAVALDVVYRPAVTPFLAKAQGEGLTAISGLGMLVRQAEASYRIWVGEAPPEGVMKKAAEIVLAGRPT